MARSFAGPKRAVEAGLAPWDRWTTRQRSRRFELFMRKYCVVPSGHGAGGPFVPMAWQHRAHVDYLDDPMVRAGFISIAAGNGKTTWAGAFGLAALCVDVEMAPEVLSFSVDLDLAARCWRTAVNMVRRSPELDRRLLIYDSDRDKRIVNPANDGVFRPAAAKRIEDMQGWNPSVAIIDEIGFVPPFVWTDLIVRGGKRLRPLFLGIGTPGYDQAGIMFQLRKTALETGMPGFLLTEYSARAGCAIDDVAEWRRANPALKEGRMAIDGLVTAMHSVPEHTFRVMNLGQWAGAAGDLFAPGELDDLGEPVRLDDGVLVPARLERGEQVAFGFDGSTSGDATGIVWARRRSDDVGMVAVWERPDGVAGEGWRVPRQQVLSVLRAHLDAWPESVLLADPWEWRTELEALADDYNTRPERPRILLVPTNSLARFGPMADRFLTAVKSGRLRIERARDHAGAAAVDQPLIRHLRQMQGKLTPAGTVVEKSKKSSPKKIDLGIAAILAHDGAHTIADPHWPTAAPARLRIF